MTFFSLNTSLFFVFLKSLYMGDTFNELKGVTLIDLKGDTFDGFFH